MVLYIYKINDLGNLKTQLERGSIMDKLSEKKVLGIFAIVFGGFGLLLSWIPIVNNFAFVLGGIALVLGLIGLLVNRKNKKVLSVIGTLISIATIALVLWTQSVYSNAINKASNDFNKQTKVVSKDSSSSSYNGDSGDNNSKSGSSSSTSSSDEDTATPESVNLGQTVTVKNVDYTFTDFKTLPGDNDLNNPGAGNQYAIVSVTMKNNGSDVYAYSSASFKFTSNGVSNDDINAVSDDYVGNQLPNGTLTNDASVTGNIYGIVKNDAGKKTVDFYDNIFDNTPTFSVILK